MSVELGQRLTTGNPTLTIRATQGVNNRGTFLEEATLQSASIGDGLSASRGDPADSEPPSDGAGGGTDTSGSRSDNPEG